MNHFRKDSWFNMELVNICGDWAETDCELDVNPFDSNGSSCADAALLVPSWFYQSFFRLKAFLPWGGWLGGGIICWCVESVLLNTKLSFASSEPDGDEPAVSPLPARSRFKWWSGILSIGAASTAHSISASSPIERSAGNRSRMRAKRPFLSGKVV